MTEPRIIAPTEEGWHNANDSGRRVIEEGLFEDQSTVIMVPALDSIPTRVVASWWNLMTPMNHMAFRMFATGYEVGNAYSTMIERVLDSDLANFKYILTLEHDNMPPADGLIKLITAMHAHPEFDAIGGLYWTKGEAGQPMIYGHPDDHPKSFRPQPPKPDTVQECLGLGMGFTLFRMDLFKDDRIERPWFRTVQEGGSQYTQDLWFFDQATKHGHRFACHTGVKVGHYDKQNDMVW